MTTSNAHFCVGLGMWSPTQTETQVRPTLKKVYTLSVSSNKYIMAEEMNAEEKNLQWELEEGIPQMSDPFIQKYFQGRDALVAQEEKHRSGL